MTIEDVITKLVTIHSNNSISHTILFEGIFWQSPVLLHAAEKEQWCLEISNLPVEMI